MVLWICDWKSCVECLTPIITTCTRYRYKQTQQESQTLTIVNQELSKLDHMISGEIGVLREKIEEANRQYNNDRWLAWISEYMHRILYVVCQPYKVAWQKP